MDRQPTYDELELRLKDLEKELRDAKRAVGMSREAENIRQLLNFAPFGVYLIDLTGKIVACNERGAAHLGKTIETSIGTVLREYFPAEIAENKRLRGMEAIQSRQSVTFEDQVEEKWYLNSIFPIFDEEGKPLRLAIYGSDVTEYKNSLDALEKSEEKYRQLSDLLPQVVFEIDEKGKLTFTNRVAFDLFGYTRADFEKGLNALQMLIPEDRERAVANIQKALRGEKLGGTEYTANTKDGRTYPVILYSSPVMREGKPVGLRGIMVDLTKVKQAEEALRESEEKYRNILESMEEGYYEVNLAGNFTFFNDAMCRIRGYTRDELMGMNNREYMDAETAKKVYKVYNEVYRNGRPVKGYEWKIMRRDGEERHVEVSVALIKNLEDKPIGFRGIVRDVTQRKQAEEAVKASQQRLSQIINFLPDATMVIDLEGKVIAWNRAIEEMTGIKAEDILGKGDYEYAIPFYGERRPVLIDLIGKWNEEIEAKYQYVKKEGESLVSETYDPLVKPGGFLWNSASLLYDRNGDAIGAIESIRDITDRKVAEKKRIELENKLHRSKKMESLGLMAGGVAHDLNNILSGIVSYPELLLMDLPEDSPLRKPIKTIQESGMRAADVVEDLLTIARGVATGKEVLNLNSIVTEYFESAELQKLKGIYAFVDIKVELDLDLLNMSGSSTHIKKTLMNLVTNASEAIEGSGTVTISTRNRYLDEPLKGYEDVHQGEYAVLSVSDEGSGISPEDLERIFEPFYTKKVMGRSGTGLGLAVVWNTVQDHNGYIDVKSSKKGTVFELYFPVTRKAVADEEEKVFLKDYLGHGEKILVVDDEERQREIACGMLTRLGYNAGSVSSGEEAIEYVKENPVDLIVLDMVMPKGINGRETYEEIIKIRPGQKAIIASGYAKTKEVDTAQQLGAGKYVKKPYTLEKIGVAVKEELEK